MRGGASTLSATAVVALERAVNGALAMDSVTRLEIAALEGTVLAIRCSTPEVQLFVIPTREGVQLRTFFEDSPSCSVSGAASDFVAILGAPDKASALVNGGLKIHGDSALLLALEKALSHLDIDWEARLAVLLGDTPAHQIGRAVRGSASWGRKAGETLLRHVEEFIHEEARLAPPRLEVEDFFTDMRLLAQDNERLEASARRLTRRVKALAERLGAAERADDGQA